MGNSDGNTALDITENNIFHNDKIIKDYEELTTKCDIIINKIKERKKKEKSTQKQIND